MAASIFLYGGSCIHFYRAKITQVILRLACKLHKYIYYMKYSSFLARTLTRLNLIAVPDTWPSADLTSNVSVPSNNLHLDNHRNGSHGGTVGIFIIENIAFDVIYRGQAGIFESIYVRLTQNKSKDIVVGAIYRPSGSKPETLQSPMGYSL